MIRIFYFSPKKQIQFLLCCLSLLNTSNELFSLFFGTHATFWWCLIWWSIPIWSESTHMKISYPWYLRQASRVSANEGPLSLCRSDVWWCQCINQTPNRSRYGVGLVIIVCSPAWSQTSTHNFTTISNVSQVKGGFWQNKALYTH